MNSTEKSIAAEQRQRILNAIADQVPLPVVSRQYVLGLAMTATVLLILPLLYITILALIAVGLVVLIAHSASFFSSWHPAARYGLMGLATFIGVSMILGMIKPFFGRTSAAKRPRALSRSAEPFLYEFVDRLCDALGVRRPAAICVTCDLNAFAEFQHAWKSLFSNQPITLRLGLPLVAGLTLKQFTGLLAHELGHFTQRTAVWLENMVRRINHGFSQAAYEPDAIDHWLSKQIAAKGPHAVLCRGVKLISRATRWILLGFATAAETVSCSMSQQMEFHADCCEARTVGARTFTQTLWQSRQLSVAYQMSFRDIKDFHHEGRLPDNLIALSIANVSLITARVKRQLRQLMLEQQTGLFASHPSDRDRIDAVNAEGASGSFRKNLLPIDLPASVLFAQFDELSKSVTLHFYQDRWNQPIKPKLLHPVDQLLERQANEMAAARALKRYFQTEVPRLRPLPIAAQSTEPPENHDEVTREVAKCRERMLIELPTYKRLTPRYRVAEETLFETIAAQALLQARLTFEPSDFSLTVATAEVVDLKQGRAREGLTNLAGKLLPFESEAGNRLSFALQLLHVQKIVEQIDDGDLLHYEVGDLLPAAQYVSRLIGELPTLRITYCRLMTLWERLDEKAAQKRTLEVIAHQISTLRHRLVTIQAEMGHHLYPFDHAKADTTLREHLLPLIPAELDIGGLVKVTDQLQSRLVSIQLRLFARLAQAAEKIESVIGMPPLPDPVEDDVND